MGFHYGELDYETALKEKDDDIDRAIEYMTSGEYKPFE